ncbi:MAG: LamG-like jellyroll fold domain-containing protein [Candidatus Thiodiazotropha lotti]
MDRSIQGRFSAFSSALSLSILIGIAGCGGGGGGSGSTTPPVTSQPGASQASLGPLSGSSIRAYRLTNLTSPVEGPITAGQSSTDLALAGSFDFELTGIPDGEWVLVTATGGSDIDADDDGVADSSPTANSGTVHALAKAADWRAGAKINVLTELAWQAVAADVQAGNTTLLESDLKWVANNLIGSDITSDTLIDYADLVAFDPANTSHRQSLVFDFRDFFSADGSGSSLIDYIHQADVSGLQARTSELFANQLSTIRVPDLVDVTVTVNLPANRAGLTATDLTVSSFVSDTAQVMDSTTPTLMMAEDSTGRTVMLGYASSADTTNYQLSAESTAMALTLMSLGNVSAADRTAISDIILNHTDFPALVAAISAAMAADPYFLDTLLNYTTLTSQLKTFASTILSEYTASVGEPNTSPRVMARIDPGAPKTFWFGSPWDGDEPWYWYGDTNKINVLDPPFLAEAQNDASKLAIANPTNINYAAEFYDLNGNLLSWRLSGRNSTMIQKAINSGAAKTDVNRGYYLDTDVAHVELNKYWFSTDLNQRRYVTTAFHLIHLATGVIGIVSDSSQLHAISQAAISNNAAMIKGAECGAALLSTVDYGQSSALEFLKSNAWSLLETTFTGCVLPISEALSGSAIKASINALFIRTLPKAAAKFSNPVGWAVVVFDIGNELGPFATSLLFADKTVGYDLTWNGNNLSEVSRNDNRPTGATTEPPAIIHPTASYSMTAVNGLTYQFDASLSEFDATANPNYEWSIDGTTYSNQSTVSHTFSTAGEKNIRLTVYDGLGNSDEITRTEEITNGQPPVITSIGCQQSPAVTNEALVNVKVIENDYPVAQVDWYLDSDDASSAVYWTPGGGFTPASGNEWTLDAGIYGINYFSTLTYPTSSIDFFAPKVVVTDSVGNTAEANCLTSVDAEPDQIVYDHTNGLMVHYSFENEAVDVSGNGFNGAVDAGGSLSYEPGIRGQAAIFDGNTRIRISNPFPQIDVTQPLTVSAWVKKTHTTKNTYGIASIWTACEGREDYFALQIYGNEGIPQETPYIIVFQAVSSNVTVPEGATSNGEWHHIVGVFDGSTSSVYTDGVLQTGTLRDVFQAPNLTTDLVLGGYDAWACTGSAFSGDFIGSMDEVRIYNRALSPTEVQELYTNQQ